MNRHGVFGGWGALSAALAWIVVGLVWTGYEE